jgi:hypothetical protein
MEEHRRWFMKGVFRNCVLGVVLLMAVSAVSLYMGQFGQAEGVSSGQGILIRGIRKIFSEAGGKGGAKEREGKKAIVVLDAGHGGTFYRPKN